MIHLNWVFSPFDWEKNILLAIGKMTQHLSSKWAQKTALLRSPLHNVTKICKAQGTSGLLVLMPGFISLPDVTSYDKFNSVVVS